MIAITATEKKHILERMPNAHIRRTVKQKSKRHKYYMEESRKALHILNEYRKSIANGGKRGTTN